jgi:phosphoribosylformimino-5-aminoimidazole carboxamide ribotide isomerase
VIITSYLFPSSTFSMEHLQSMLRALDNDKTKLVIDLSCRRKDDKWFVATNKWQTITDFELNQGTCSSPSLPTLSNTT